MTVPTRNEWSTPSVLIAAFGLLAGAGGSYIAFDGRLSAVEARTEFNTKTVDSINAKLDRLIEQGK